MTSSPKPRTHSTTFLSGEADPEAQRQRKQRLGGLLSLSDNGNSSTSNPSSFQTASRVAGGTSSSSSSGRPRIQVVAETTSTADVAIESDSDEGDDPPPIFSEDIVQASTNAPPHAQPTKNISKNEVEGPSLMEQLLADAAKVQKEKDAKTKAKERKEAKNASFGMKKGFLNSGGSSKKKGKNKKAAAPNKAKDKENTSSKDDDVFEIDSDGNLIKSADPKSIDIPTIRPKTKGSKGASEADRLRLQEVQDAMQNTSLERLAASGGEWANDDLMEKVAQNPRLAVGLRNPKFTAALEAMQNDPRGAMEKFADHPEIMDFLREFCGVMGEHFTKLGAEQEKAAATKGAEKTIGPLAAEAVKRSKGIKTTSDAEPPMSKKEKEQLDKITSNPQLTELLMDPNMQRVIQECALPGRMGLYMNHPEIGPKLRLLLESGLLKVA